MKQKRLLVFLLFVAISMFFTSCDPIKRNLNDMDSLVSDAEQNGKEYSESDWQDFVESFAAFQEALNDYSGDLTRDDYRELGSISARYHKVILAYSMDALKSGLNASSSFMQGYMDEMGGENGLDEIGEEFESVFDESIDEFNNIFNH